MSVITRFSVYTHCNDLGGKVWNPAIRWTKKYAVFVLIENDEGISGLGECWCFDSAPDTLVTFLRTELAPHIVGMKVADYPARYRQLLSRATLTARHGLLTSALSGVDIALCDLQSRAAEQPLWEFLSEQTSEHQASEGQVYLYASGGLYGENKSIDDLVAEMQSLQVDGFDVLKMKIGALSLSEDVARIEAVLSELNSDVGLIIDGVYSYSLEEALNMYRSLPEDRIEAFQSPVAAWDIDSMKVLCDEGVPVMGTEAEYREEIHQQLLQQNAVEFLQTAPIACGGISRLLELEENIALVDGDCTHLSLEVSSTAVALMAACHYAAASESVAHTEYHYVHQVFFDRLDLTPLDSEPGWFQLSDKPGLGISLPMSSVKTEFEWRH